MIDRNQAGALKGLVGHVDQSGRFVDDVYRNTFDYRFIQPTRVFDPQVETVSLEGLARPRRVDGADEEVNVVDRLAQSVRFGGETTADNIGDIRALK